MVGLSIKHGDLLIKHGDFPSFFLCLPELMGDKFTQFLWWFTGRDGQKSMQVLAGRSCYLEKMVDICSVWTCLNIGPKDVSWFTICIYIYIHIYINTSSTAQGGGGSFKNRKPIGEVSFCESGMAKRIHWWTERCLRSPLCLSLSLTIYLPIYLLCIYLSI